MQRAARTVGESVDDCKCKGCAHCTKCDGCEACVSIDRYAMGKHRAQLGHCSAKRASGRARCNGCRPSPKRAKLVAAQTLATRPASAVAPANDLFGGDLLSLANAADAQQRSAALADTAAATAPTTSVAAAAPPHPSASAAGGERAVVQAQRVAAAPALANTAAATAPTFIAPPPMTILANATSSELTLGGGAPSAVPSCTLANATSSELTLGGGGGVRTLTSPATSLLKQGYCVVRNPRGRLKAIRDAVDAAERRGDIIYHHIGQLYPGPELGDKPNIGDKCRLSADGLPKKRQQWALKLLPTMLDLLVQEYRLDQDVLMLTHDELVEVKVSCQLTEHRQPHDHCHWPMPMSAHRDPWLDSCCNPPRRTRY